MPRKLSDIANDIDLPDTTACYPPAFLQAAQVAIPEDARLKKFLSLVALPTAGFSPGIRTGEGFLLTQTLQAELAYSNWLDSLPKSTNRLVLAQIDQLEIILKYSSPARPERSQPIAYALARLAKTAHFNLLAPRFVRTMWQKYEQLIRDSKLSSEELSNRLLNFITYGLILAEKIPAKSLPASWEDFDQEPVDATIEAAINAYVWQRRLAPLTRLRIQSSWAAAFYAQGLDKSLVTQSRIIGQRNVTRKFVAKIQITPLPEDVQKKRPKMKATSKGRMSRHYLAGQHPERQHISIYDNRCVPLSIYKHIQTKLNMTTRNQDPDIETKRAVFHLLLHCGQSPEWIESLAVNASNSPHWLPQHGAIRFSPDSYLGWPDELEAAAQAAVAGDRQARANLRLLGDIYQSASLHYYMPVPPALADCFLANQNTGMLLPWQADGPVRPLEAGDVKTIVAEWNDWLHQTGLQLHRLTVNTIRGDFERYYHHAGLDPEFRQLLSGKDFSAYQLSYWYRSTTAERLFSEYYRAYQQVAKQISDNPIEIGDSPPPKAVLGSWRVAKKVTIRSVFQQAIQEYCAVQEQSDSPAADRIRATQSLLIPCLLLFLGMRPFEINRLKIKYLSGQNLVIDGKSHAGREGARLLPLHPVVSALLHQLAADWQTLDPASEDLFADWTTADINRELHRLTGDSNKKPSPEAYAWRFLFYQYALRYLPLSARRYLMGHEEQGIESNNGYVDFDFYSLPGQVYHLIEKMIAELNLHFQVVLVHAQKT